MTKHVLLNNIEHKDLRVKTGYSSEFGDNVASALTFPTEYGDVHKEYPILFQKNAESGKYVSAALLGFQKHENLFLNESASDPRQSWSARYVPGIIAKGPFLIGFQDQSADGGSAREPVIHLDLDSPRISHEDGEPLFREFGGNSAYLANIGNILQGIHKGFELSEAMFAIFEHFELIEPVAINIEFNNGEKVSLDGNYTVSQEKLANLNGEALEQLNKSGFLQGAFLVISSLGNLKNLIEIKNSRLSM